MASNNKKKSEYPPQTKKRTKTQTPDPAAKGPAEPTNRPKGLTVVGIGASAGGLSALQSFFDALPGDTGMAFVVITHLHPEHESHMAELLQRHTVMPTSQVVDRVKVEPNRVYVIPPNRSILMADSHVQAVEFLQPHGRRTPIDQFFRSLASGHRESIAVILSGGGTDGSVGVKDIKEQGGLILVQHPADAEYDSMPRAAISTGLADVVLPADQLAAKLADYARHTPQLPHDPGELTESEVEILQRILAQVHARTGHDFNQYKRSTILRRVERRMQLNGFTTLEAYLDYLRHHANEAQAMFNDILIGVTNFFRDRDSWQAVEENAIPALFRDEGREAGIRAWSIGCATGEEAYSLAILLLEHATRLDFRPQIQVFASDLDETSIAHAREGLYPAAIEADVSPERLERFFTREGGYYRVKRELRDAVLFSNHNLLRDPPFARQDLIACRNVLIYLQREVQESIFTIFHYALKPDGYLFLGSSESAEHLPDLFAVVDKSHRIYQAKPWVGERPPMPSLPLRQQGGRPAKERPVLTRSYLLRYQGENIPAEMHRRALETYSPPSILVNERATVLHVSETAGRYLLQPAGAITGDLLRLVRPELQLELRVAISRAFEENRAALSRPVLVQFNGHPRPVILAVRPSLKAAAQNEANERTALVVFLEDELDKPLAPKSAETPSLDQQKEREHVVAQLEAEVERLREQLQITVEEYESSNEEMKAANEELQSINEEYRSVTEELETSKEELQSINEELQTVNIDMKNKLEELARAHEELQNLLGATEIGLLFLDRELRIQRFTAGMSALFNIMPGDRGRPIPHLTHKMKYDGFIEDAEQVLRRLIPVEREVQAENEDWFLMRLRPYRTTEDQIQGVVISFVDINKLKEAEQELIRTKSSLEQSVEERTRELDQANQKISQTLEQFLTLFHANPIPTALTRLEDGHFLDINPAYAEFFGVERHQVIGRSSKETNLPLAAKLRIGVVARLQEEGMIRNLEMEVTLPSGEPRTVLASLQRVTVDNVEAIISTFIDITDRVRAEQNIRSLVSKLTAGEQAERQRIARILHDELQQKIFAVKMQLTFLSEAIEKSNPQGLHLDLKQLDEWLADAIATTRQLSVDLSPPILQGEGLAEALIWLASQMKEQYGLDVVVDANGVSPVFDEDVRVLLFQSVRELLFNVVKHAGILKAQIALEQADGQVRILVSDNGKGFDSTAIMKDRFAGRGLIRIRDRLSLLGCDLTVKSEPNRGTQIAIEAPIKGTME